MEQPKKPKLQEKLSKQDLIFVDKVVETGKLTQSVINAYGIEDPKYASVKAQRLIAKDSIMNAIEVKRESLKTALENEGITPSYIAEKVNVLLKAKDDRGQTDFTAVDKGLKHALSIHGVEDAEKPKSQSIYNFIFNTEAQAKIKEMEEQIKAKLKNPDVN